jgi:hypothetical protein
MSHIATRRKSDRVALRGDYHTRGVIGEFFLEYRILGSGRLSLCICNWRGSTRLFNTMGAFWSIGYMEITRSKNKESMLTATLAVLDLMERGNLLTFLQRRRLCHGRRKWVHAFRPRNTLTYRISDIYFKFRAMWGLQS